MKSALFAAALVAGALSTHALAGAASGETIVKTIGNATVTIKNGKGFIQFSKRSPHQYVPPPSHDGLTTVFSNIATAYPDGLYYCCQGSFDLGPKGIPGGLPELWTAAAFTPANDAKIKEIDLALSYISGANSAVVALYDDNANLPGNLIKKFPVTDMPIATVCCGLTVVKIPQGISVTAGKQYWVAVQTNPNNSDLDASWEFNTSEEIAMTPTASWCSDDVSHTGICGELNDIWDKADTLPNVAFAVYGK